MNPLDHSLEHDYSVFEIKWRSRVWIASEILFLQLEALVRDMQDKVHGVPVRHQKVFLTSIPFAFMGKLLLKQKLLFPKKNQGSKTSFFYIAGYDLIEWLMDRLSIEDSRK